RRLLEGPGMGLRGRRVRARRGAGSEGRDGRRLRRAGEGEAQDAMKTALALFFGFFALYVHSMAPGLAPYRDTGEMVVSAGTLGVSHPPSYPLYILLGRAFENLPLAEPAYRLSLLSCAAGAAAVALLFLLITSEGTGGVGSPSPQRVAGLLA